MIKIDQTWSHIRCLLDMKYCPILELHVVASCVHVFSRHDTTFFVDADRLTFHVWLLRPAVKRWSFHQWISSQIFGKQGWTAYKLLQVWSWEPLLTWKRRGCRWFTNLSIIYMSAWEFQDLQGVPYMSLSHLFRTAWGLWSSTSISIRCAGFSWRRGWPS